MYLQYNTVYIRKQAFLKFPSNRAKRISEWANRGMLPPLAFRDTVIPRRICMIS